MWRSSLLGYASVCDHLFCFCVQEVSEGRSLSGSATFSLDTLNKLRGGSGSGLYLGGGTSGGPSSSCRLSSGRGLEPVGSLYDGFASCTSQASNNV